MTNMEILKKMRKGLTPKENFDPNEYGDSYPHCVIAESNMYADVGLTELGFTFNDLIKCARWPKNILTHKEALAMIDRAIRRMKKLEDSEYQGRIG